MTFTLYDFQQDDVEKLKHGGSALIGSEMGTGKTHEAIELGKLWKQAGPVLIVAPRNVLGSWAEKYEQQQPNARVITCGRKPKERQEFIRKLKWHEADYGLVHWEAVRLISKDLKNVMFSLIVADECHRMSNRKTQQTRALKSLKAKHKLAMSGTASGDKPEGLWSILHWLYPKEYTSYWRFRKTYCQEELQRRGNATYTQIVGVKNMQELHDRIAPFYVRHLKRETCCTDHPGGVMNYLPEKSYDKVMVSLNKEQRRLYDQMRKEMVAWIGEHEEDPLMASAIVAQLVRLNQISLGTPEISDEGRVRLTTPSTKVDAAKEIITDEPGKQFVVMTSSKQAANLAVDALPRAAALHGDVGQKDREARIKQFTSGELQTIVGTIATMGEGVDGLQYASDTMIFLDRMWSSIRNKQAEDRLHRQGQESSALQIIDIMAENTLDAGRHQKLEYKWDWIKKVLGDGNEAGR